MTEQTDLKKQIGNRVRELRKEKNISQEKFATRCGIDRHYMSDIECGKRNLSMFTLDIIITAFNCGYEHFFCTEYFKTHPKLPCHE